MATLNPEKAAEDFGKYARGLKKFKGKNPNELMKNSSLYEEYLNFIKISDRIENIGGSNLKLMAEHYDLIFSHEDITESTPYRDLKEKNLDLESECENLKLKSFEIRKGLETIFGPVLDVIKDIEKL